MLFSVTHQQANQIAAALRIFQAIKHHGGEFREIDGRHVTIETMEHFEECEPLEDQQIEAMIDAVYFGSSPIVRPGLWHNRPDFDEDEDEPNGHTLIVDSHLNPVLVTCTGTQPADLAKATAAPQMFDALTYIADRLPNFANWDDVDRQKVNNTITEAIQAASGGAQ